MAVFSNYKCLQLHMQKIAAVAVSHPQCKLRWMPPSKRESVRAMFVQCVESCPATDSASQDTATSWSDDDDYGFNEHSTDMIRVNSIEAQVSSYLTDSERSSMSLLKYRAMKTVRELQHNSTVVCTGRKTVQHWGTDRMHVATGFQMTPLNDCCC